ncbi:hypothetical protein L2K20_02000 [Mycobacterium sp. MBM]|nr:hypothetical protein [Mycobacterium sp. MBM]
MKNTTVTRVTAGAALGGALLLFGGAAAANAESADGRVDVAIGTAGVLTGVPIETATQIAAGVCDSDETTVAAVAESVDISGAQQSVCDNSIGAVDFRQNTATAEGASLSEQPVAPSTTTTVPAPSGG